MISIIIPVYNGERTIGRCLRSVLSQSFCDFEVVVIDDGSTDGTFRICLNLPMHVLKLYIKSMAV